MNLSRLLNYFRRNLMTRVEGLVRIMMSQNIVKPENFQSISLQKYQIRRFIVIFTNFV